VDEGLRGHKDLAWRAVTDRQHDLIADEDGSAAEPYLASGRADGNSDRTIVLAPQDDLARRLVLGLGPRR
jgi:hypothetical protein